MWLFPHMTKVTCLHSHNFMMKKDLEIKIQNKLREKLLLLPDFAADFIFSLENSKEISTRYEYTKDIIIFLEFLIYSGSVDATNIKEISNNMIEKLEEKDIRNFLDYLTEFKKEFKTTKEISKKQVFTNSVVGKSRKLATLHKFFSYLFRNKLITKDITQNIEIKVPIRRKIKDRLEKDEIEKLFSTIMDDVNIESKNALAFHEKVKYRDYTIVLLLSYTGIRISELIQLDIKDINIEKKQIIITRKGGNQEIITLPYKIIEDMQTYLEMRKSQEYTTPALFVSLRKKRIDTRTIRVMLEKYRLRAGIDIKLTPHVFRRTFGTEHYNKYKDMYLTAQILGHTSAETTRKYYAEPNEERKIRTMTEFDY